MQKLKLINKVQTKQRDLGLEKLVNDYKQLNEIGRAKANEYLSDVLTQIRDYTCNLTTVANIEEVSRNVIYTEFKREQVRLMKDKIIIVLILGTITGIIPALIMGGIYKIFEL